MRRCSFCTFRALSSLRAIPDALLAAPPSFPSASAKTDRHRRCFVLFALQRLSVSSGLTLTDSYLPHMCLSSWIHPLTLIRRRKSR